MAAEDASNFPLVIPKTKKINLGEGSVLTQERLGVEIAFQGKSDVQNYMKALATVDTQEQIELGNPPQIVTVDGKTNKQLVDIQRNIVVIFGTQLAKEAMAMVEREVRRVIQAMGLIDTGATLDRSNWEWIYKKKGAGGVVVTSVEQIASFNIGDNLIYYPKGVPHAGWANWMGKKRVGAGFMGVAAMSLRKTPVFKQFSVMAQFTLAHAVPGNDYPHGTPIIVIRPRIRRGT